MVQLNQQSEIGDRQSPLPFTFRPPGRVDGRYVGRHQSVKRGRSQAFEDHRAYMPGDDVRDVDWKLYARSDKLYVKRYEMHTQLSVYMVLDASVSMAYAGRHAEPGAMGKFAAAQQAALGLSRVVLAQQDRVGLSFTDANGLQMITARGGMDQWSKLEQACGHAVPSSKIPTDQALSTLAAGHRRAVAVVFSDLMHPRKPLLDALWAWKARGGEAMVLQVLHPDEVSLPKDWQASEAVDPETGRMVGFDPARMGDAFADRSAQWVQGWKQALVSKGVDHRLLVCGRPWVDAMRHWLSPV